MEITTNYSSIWLSLLALAGGLVMLVGGGESLVGGATRFAYRLGMRPLLVGLTIVAFGTSLPELFVSVHANIQGHPDIMIGNVIGSNIANIGMVLAFCALFSVLTVPFQRISLELYLVVSASVAVMGITFLSAFYRIIGVFFVAGLIFYTYVAYKKGLQEKNCENGEIKTSDGSYVLIFVLQTAGLVLMALGSDFFIKGAVDVARILGVSELVIGLTAAAVGTSLPELASSLSAVRQGQGEMLVGNIVGSNLFNLLMVMGGTAVVKPFVLSRDLLFRDLPVMLVFSVVLLAILYFRKELNRWHGIFLLAAYGGYLYLLA